MKIEDHTYRIGDDGGGDPADLAGDEPNAKYSTQSIMNHYRSSRELELSDMKSSSTKIAEESDQIHGFAERKHGGSDRGTTASSQEKFGEGRWR